MPSPRRTASSRTRSPKGTSRSSFRTRWRLVVRRNPSTLEGVCGRPGEDPECAGHRLYLLDDRHGAQEHGYHGAIHILVGLNPNATINGVVVDYDSEPYGYFSVDPQEFADQFKGKSIFDKFVVGADVDAVSRASLSINSATRAIRDSTRMVARALLDPSAVKR